MLGVWRYVLTAHGTSAGMDVREEESKTGVASLYLLEGKKGSSRKTFNNELK